MEKCRRVRLAILAEQPTSNNRRDSFCVADIYISFTRSLRLFATMLRPTRALRMPILKKSSYYEADYRQSPALIRARRPYLVKNAITGVAIMSFAIGVCM